MAGRSLRRWHMALQRALACSSFAVVLMLALAAPLSQAREAEPLFKDPALEARVTELAEELRCLVCQNESIAASQADLAVELRNQIRTRLRDGESKAQILDYMVARYGEFVRYRPAFSGTTALLWAGPFAMLALAAFVLVSNIRRQRRSVRPDGATSDEAPTAIDTRIRAGASASPKAVSRSTTVALAAAVPIAAACLYMLIGNPDALSAANAPQAATRPEPTDKDMADMLDNFAKTLAERPPGRFEDLEGWVMMARTFATMKRFDEAAMAFSKASALAPRDAQLLADWADVVAMQQGPTSAKDAAALVERALQMNPANLKALALAGSGAYERKDFAAAIKWWTEARALAPPTSEFAASLDQSLVEARAATADPRGPIARAQP